MAERTAKAAKASATAETSPEMPTPPAAPETPPVVETAPTEPPVAVDDGEASASLDEGATADDDVPPATPEPSVLALIQAEARRAELDGRYVAAAALRAAENCLHEARVALDAAADAVTDTDLGLGIAMLRATI